jgi:hypothetical protein
MNRFESFFRPLMWFMAIMMAAVVAGCGGGGGGGGAAPPAAAAAPIGDVSGTWAVTESAMTADQTQCAPPSNPLANYALTVAQATPATNAITVTDAANASPAADFSGTINGNKLSWSGSFKERGGTTTYNSVDLAVGTDCNTLAGTTTWTYVQDAPATFSCTGNTTLSATKNGGATCAPPASGS